MDTRFVVNAAGSGMWRRCVITSGLEFFVPQLIYEGEQGLPVLPSRARQIDADDTQYCDREHR